LHIIGVKYRGRYQGIADRLKSPGVSLLFKDYGLKFLQEFLAAGQSKIFSILKTLKHLNKFI